jgi:hypothetical protein
MGVALDAGFLFGPQSSEYNSAFSFNILLNTTVDTKNIFGLGSGVEYLGQSFMPLILEYKYIISDKKTTPFIFIRGGKLFHLSGDQQNTDSTVPQYDNNKSYEGGGSFTLGTGISWVREGVETYLSFAYRNAHTSYTQTNFNNQTATYKNTYNRLEVKLGFRF